MTGLVINQFYILGYWVGSNLFCVSKIHEPILGRGGWSKVIDCPEGSYYKRTILERNNGFKLELL